MKRLLGIPLCSFVALATSGCTFLVDNLPEPGPIFTEAVNYPAEPQGCLRPLNVEDSDGYAGQFHTVTNCDGATERVSAYLARYLPAEPEHLNERLEELGFACKKLGTQASTVAICEHLISQAIAPCRSSYSTRVLVKYEAGVSLVRHLDAEVTVRPGDVDPRGCFPL